MSCDKCGYESDIDFAHACPKAMAHITQGELMHLSMQINQLTEERDALKAALEKVSVLALCGKRDHAPGRLDKIARITYESLKGFK